jgi:hypothetical protein
VAYTCSPVVYSLFVKTSLINQTPTLIFHWSDIDGYLETDSNHPTAPAVKDDVKEWFNFLSLALNSNLTFSSKSVQDWVNKMKNMRETLNLSNYTTIRGIVSTQQAITQYGLDKSKLPTKFLSNKDTLIFEPTGLSPPSSYFRTDPYAGMMCAFDNLFCRDNSGKRIVNIILRAKDVKLSKLVSKGTFIQKRGHNENNCPFGDLATVMKMSKKEIQDHIKSSNCPFTSSKQQRVYGEVADVIVFDDSVYYG